MYASFEDKGKIFTDIITKQPVAVILQTSTELIQGNFHVRPGVRIKEELENSERFVIITDAIVFGPDGKVHHKAKMMIINLSQLIWMLPVDEMVN
jgi:hypothetical protein